MKETTELVKFAAHFCKAIKLGLADDGKIGFSDAPKFLPALLSMPAAFTGLHRVAQEVRTMTPDVLVAVYKNAGVELTTGKALRILIDSGTVTTVTTVTTVAAMTNLTNFNTIDARELVWSQWKQNYTTNLRNRIS